MCHDNFFLIDFVFTLVTTVCFQDLKMIDDNVMFIILIIPVGTLKVL